ncbi:hypothetical protein [Methylobacterium sp. AMS5]|uniref:hypothetical protein n=1 Tax=Methylobacterium sp. AMS5 TaxID=925818 RepID=UPI000762CF21|nr:hypothetical protein [Methylobacterium sp. AMS5]
MDETVRHRRNRILMTVLRVEHEAPDKPILICVWVVGEARLEGRFRSDDIESVDPRYLAELDDLADTLAELDRV